MNGKVLPFRLPTEATSTLSDAALVGACATGDSGALGVLFERFNASIYRFLSRYVGPQNPDLDDLVQATFLEVLRSAGRFRHDAAVQTWIFGIAVNVARHYRRSERRRQAMVTNLVRHPQEHRVGPDHTAERREQVSRLEQAVAQLSDNLRTAFVMCDVEDLPGAEVARVLHLREGTLWRRLHEARKTLRKILEEGQHESRDLPDARRTLAGILLGRRR